MPPYGLQRDVGEWIDAVLRRSAVGTIGNLQQLRHPGPTLRPQVFDGIHRSHRRSVKNDGVNILYLSRIRFDGKPLFVIEGCRWKTHVFGFPG